MLAFQIQGLDYRYHQELILKDIHLDYDCSDFLAIIGPNGGGKSTLIKIILGLLKGSVSVQWKHFDKKHIGYVPQSTWANLDFPASVLDVVMMGRVAQKWFGFYDATDRKKALEALEKVGLDLSFAKKKISELSGGQRQKVFIARALVGDCQMLILDEPTASVDAKSAVQIFNLLDALHKEGVGMIVVCHDINLVLAYANQIAYLNQELFLHDSIQESHKQHFIQHLLDKHHHFCGVEMMRDQCACEKK